MAWTVEYDPRVDKVLRGLDRQVAKKIVDYLDGVAALNDPRSRGKALTGRLAGLWRYRIGDWRAICDLQDNKLVVVVLEVGHRSEIYDH